MISTWLLDDLLPTLAIEYCSQLTGDPVRTCVVYLLCA